MNDGRLMEADLGFIRYIKKAGGSDLKKCYQCATCSSVCSLSPAEKPFPRKEMLLAGWGQEKKLVSDPDIWLCYQCNDCATYCPRGAKPGNVLAAIRSYIYQYYAVPSFMGKALANPKALPLLFLAPMAVLAAMIWGSSGGDFSFINGEIVFTKETLYYTETMRLFVIPKGSDPVKSEQISFSTRKAEDITYYYGEWSGAGGSQIDIRIKGPSSGSDGDNGDYSKGIGTFLIIAGVVFAVIFGFFVFRNKSKGRHRSTKKKGMKREPSEDKKPSQRGTKPAPSEDKKAKKQQEKLYDALLRLEEDFDAGSIDKETYDSSKGIYLDYLKELKKK